MAVRMRKIVSTPGTVGGAPRIEGSRWTCANVVGAMWHNDYTIGQFLSEFETQFCDDDIVTCLKYCASKQCVSERVHSFCEHCTLDVQWGAQMAEENLAAIREGLPPPNEPQENYWEFANQLLKKFAIPKDVE